MTNDIQLLVSCSVGGATLSREYVSIISEIMAAYNKIPTGKTVIETRSVWGRGHILVFSDKGLEHEKYVLEIRQQLNGVWESSLSNLSYPSQLEIPI